MNNRHIPLPDAARSRLRAIVATIDLEISLLPRRVTVNDGETPTNGLAASWDDLVARLALGAHPEVRECPVCEHIGMRAASVCGYCSPKPSPPTEHRGLAA